MDGLSDTQRAELEDDLDALIESLRDAVESARERSRPVDLDEPIGRVSRIDAIQQQSMVQAGRQAAQRRLALAEGARRRIAEGDYGECAGCGEQIGFARLKARPETPFCVGCQEHREGSR
jgi:DnaK suppressor protein